jgi:beta-lactamase class A
MYMKIIPFVFACCSLTFCQRSAVPAYFSVDTALTHELRSIAAGLGLDNGFDTGEDGIVKASLAVVDLSTDPPRFAGMNENSFIYPASVYKMYVAAEVLHQISERKYSLSDPFVVKSPNDVDKTKEILSDPRPLLRNGDTVSVNYLLDLMITRSDNSAANCLIDLARRENINALMEKYHWNGSEVTRKYLSRKFEDSGYADITSTVTNALHAADFMYRIYTNTLCNPWVSMQMKTFLGRQLDNTKLAPGLPDSAMFYHKTGWYASWTHDVGIVDDGSVRYVIACLLPLPEETARPKMKEFSERIFNLLKSKKDH